jgi:DNA primase
MEFRDQVKAASDIVRVIGEYVPSLKRAGSTGRYKGLCPFHTEKTPSFSVLANIQYFTCFGCGEKGDVFTFVEKIERVSFYEALKMLAERANIPMPKRAEYADADTKLRAAVYRMHEIAADVFRSSLASPSGAEARGYLDKRGVTPDTVREFGLGLSERTGHTLVNRFQREQFSSEQMEASGLVNKRQDGSGFFDRFRGRLMFPIHNESGKVIGFGGRALAAGDEPKYLNSPETAIYRKSQVLYNLHRAKEAVHKAGRGILVEGYMDAIGLYAAGIHEVVASCGTALTPLQVKALRRHSENIVVNFDPDAAGSNAAERSIQMLLEEGMRVRVLELDEDLDPDEYVRKHGTERYNQALGRAPGYFHWLADRARKKFDMSSGEGRIQAFNQMLLPAIQRMNDKLERAAIADDVASYLGVEKGFVLDQFRKSAAERKAPAAGAPAPEPVRPVERMLLSLLIGRAEFRGEVIGRIRSLSAIKEFRTVRVFEVIFGLWENEPEFGFSELEGRLEDQDKTLLTRMLFADEVGEESVSLEQAMECVRALEASEVELSRAGLRARIKAAERAGNLEEAMRLAGQWEPRQRRPSGGR